VLSSAYQAWICHCCDDLPQCINDLGWLPQAIQGQIDRDDALRGLVACLADLYSFVDAVDGLENKIKLLEDVIIRISVQTTECGIFIRQCVSHGFAGRMLDRSSVVLLCSVLNNQFPRPTNMPSDLTHFPDDLGPLVGSKKAQGRLSSRSDISRCIHLGPNIPGRETTWYESHCRMCATDVNPWSLQLKSRH
jgi:hypothetical protein